MGYTCKDCKVQCIERSREYPCASFKLMTASESGIKRVKGMGSKKIPVENQKALEELSEALRR